MKFRDTHVGGFFTVSGTNDEQINTEINHKLTMLNADMEDAQYCTTLWGDVITHHILIMYKPRTSTDGSINTPVRGAMCSKLDHALRTAMYLESYTGNLYYVRVKLSQGKDVNDFEYLVRLAHMERSEILTVDAVNPGLKDDRYFNLSYDTYKGMLRDTHADAYAYEVVAWKDVTL